MRSRASGLVGRRGRAGLAVQDEAQVRELRLDDDAPATGTTLSSTPTGRPGSVPGPAWEKLTGPAPVTVQVVSGIGIVTTIGVPETKFAAGVAT